MMISRQHKPPVVLDVDGVLLNFEQAWKQCAEETLQHAVIRKENTWDLATRFGLSSENVRQVWDAFHADGWFGRIDPYPYAWELVGALKAMGCEVFAITNVDPAFFRERALTLGDLIPEKICNCLGRRPHQSSACRYCAHSGRGLFSMIVSAMLIWRLSMFR
ncbi:HAD family hydrolase [Acidithiobacillus thiooxidans]|uniref:HAD family hydrolase n=1 Tax=Acidithiobacillus thiooxidans TaxID=930 RepID=UPI00068F9825|nr:HAD family hydrolase [Acidithiobacillus thiooxidans]